jgi:hypothetical protein
MRRFGRLPPPPVDEDEVAIERLREVGRRSPEVAAAVRSLLDAWAGALEAPEPASPLGARLYSSREMTFEQRQADKAALEVEFIFLFELIAELNKHGLTEKQVRAKMKEGELPWTRTRRGIAVRRADLERFLTTRR